MFVVNFASVIERKSLMFNRRIFMLLSLTLSSLLWWSSSANARENEVPRFESAPCPITFQSQYTVQCGYLVVPAEHDTPDGKTIKVAVAVFKSRSLNPRPDPIIYLSGGPGSRTLDSFVNGLGGYLETARDSRDIILVDQRGMGYSEPVLSCPEIDALLLRDEQGPSDAEQPLQQKAIQECYQRLSGQGVNIAAFNTVESAADIAALGPALGYLQVNLDGGSYGSTLAMTVMRHHPAVIRSVVLQGVTPPEVDLMASFGPDFEHALTLVFEACKADATCDAAYPNLTEMFYQVVQRLETQPISLQVRHPVTRRTVKFHANEIDFIAATQWAMYSSSTIRQLPALIAATYSGNLAVLEPLALTSITISSFSTIGANFAMRCMDDVMTTTPQQWQAAIDSIHPALQHAFRTSVTGLEWWTDVCAMGWGARQLDPVENTPVQSDLPTLLMTGKYDPVTPSVWAVDAAPMLPNSFVFDFPDSGHGVNATPCAIGIFNDFVNDPTIEPQTQCISNLKGIQFVTP
jgi:pimeloyl-ACP methyl ester carboxylesterase